MVQAQIKDVNEGMGGFEGPEFSPKEAQKGIFIDFTLILLLKIVNTFKFFFRPFK